MNFERLQRKVRRNERDKQSCKQWSTEKGHNHP